MKKQTRSRKVTNREIESEIKRLRKHKRISDEETGISDSLSLGRCPRVACDACLSLSTEIWFDLFIRYYIIIELIDQDTMCGQTMLPWRT